VPQRHHSIGICRRARPLLWVAFALWLLCSYAHAEQVRTNFDHDTTGFELTGQHRDLRCESCHANAIFKGTPRACGSCHGVGTVVRATAKPDNHILSTNACGVCHGTNAWNPAVNFDHNQALGSCSTCHNGVQAQGKPPTHIVTDLECDACHTTMTWAGAVFSHQGISSGCASCHNNVQALGMPSTHIPVGTVPCEGCHSATNFSSFAGTKINHVAAATLTCASCHETAAYLGMHPSTSTTAADSRPPAALDKSHPTTGDCGQCHDTTTFASTALRPANHIPTSAPCAQCHTTSGNYAAYSLAGVHQGVTSCLSCHGANVGPFANISPVTLPGTHIPIGGLDCNGSGCHTTANLNPGGFRLGTGNISMPTLSAAGHTTVAAAVTGCQSCHETAPYLGMLASTATAPGDSRPTALDKNHPSTGECSGCHSTSPTFGSNLSNAAKPANHIPTSAPCAQCHTNGNYAAYSLGGTHQGVSGCLSCHGATLSFANITIVGAPAGHIPIGSLDCNGSGCHTTAHVNPGGFKLGNASISAPTLSVAGHGTVSAVTPACQTCHETAPYLGMLASTTTAAADSRPTAFDAAHPASGDCGNCHVTTPTFASNLLPSAPKPANHIPTTATCAQCHTTAGNFALYSVSGTHVGVTACLSCHAPPVAGTFANVTIATLPGNHMPVGSLDCGSSGCHTTKNVNPGGFKIGPSSISAPTLTVAGHTTVAAAVSGCQTCHESAPYAGMLASTATAAGDSRPTALDKAHPTSGDCSACHTTTPTFGGNQTAGAKPANHIPTTAACTQCHTTAGNYAAYSVVGTHTGLTSCLSCHAPAVAGTFANVTIVSLPGNHMPVGGLDCGSSGCHTTKNVNPGGFKIGPASISAPTLSVAGHTTVAGAVSGCQTCHERAPYAGMLASTATAAGDTRPTAFDKAHPSSGDCNGCHTTTPTFTSNVTGGSKPTNHIPTNAPCAQCHTTAGSYAAYVMGAAGHKGISNNCAQCHAYGLSFYNMAPPTLVEPPAGATGHIPAVPPNGTATIACELCHSAANFTTFSGTIMRHAYVSTMKCMSCHERGMKWKTNSGVQLWVRPEASHHAGQDCIGSGCHTSRDKFAIRPVVARPSPSARGQPVSATGTQAGAAAAGATGVPAIAGPFVHPSGGTCRSCHQAGRPAMHIASSDRCEQCHSTIAWLPVRFVDHTQVKGACASCHDAAHAPGKPARHLQTSAPCESCHTTNTWSAVRVDHAAVAAHTCGNCHNSVQATGLPRTHVATTQPCDSCHGTLGWRPARVDHSRLHGPCAGCHNNVAAVGLPADHLRLRRDCAECHAYPDWDLVHFRHVASAYPGDHRAQLACNACHTGNTEAVPYAAPGSAATCAACHARDFVPAAHPKVAKGASYTVSELANCSGACHVYGDAAQSRIAKPLPGPHHRVSDAVFKH
jgi:hypothetical protein